MLDIAFAHKPAQIGFAEPQLTKLANRNGELPAVAICVFGVFAGPATAQQMPASISRRLSGEFDLVLSCLTRRPTWLTPEIDCHGRHSARNAEMLPLERVGCNRCGGGLQAIASGISFTTGNKKIYLPVAFTFHQRIERER